MRGRTIAIALLGLGLAVGARDLAAQGAARIQGIVTMEETGEPIGGALVRLLEIDRETVTTSAGRFVFEGLSPGRHTIVVEALGRAVHRRVVMVPAGAEDPIAIALASQAIEAPPIEVVVDRFRVVGGPRELQRIPGSAHLIGPEELDDQKLLYDDVHQILRQVPGLNIQEEDGYGLRPNIGIRGTGSERSSKITLMEDGVLAAPAPYAAPAAYYFPLAGRMEAIEVRKGSSQIKYGPHTIGGAINLVSSPIPDDFAWTLDGEGGEDSSGKLRARIGDAYENFGWLVETYQIRTDGFKRLDGGGDTGFEIGDYVAKLRVNTDPGARLDQVLELKLGWYGETSKETYLGLTEDDFRADPLRRYAASREDVMDAEHRLLQLNHVIRPARTIDVSTVLYRNDFQRNWYKLQSVGGEGPEEVLDDPAAFPGLLAILEGATSDPGALIVRANNREYYAQGIQSIVGIQWADRHAIELGGRYHEDEEDRFQHDDAFRMVDGEMVLTARGAPGSQSNRVSGAAAWSFFAQDEISFGRWTVTPGVRYETIDFTRTDYASDDPDRTSPTDVRESEVDGVIPGIGATFEATPDLRLFGGVHRGFGPPGPGANEETKPEESVNYELGGRWLGPGFATEILGFYNDYENILGLATLASGDPTGSGDLFNGGAVTVSGLEVSLDADLAGRSSIGIAVPARVVYTYTSAEFETSFESDFEPWGSVEERDELPYVPAHQLYTSVGLERGPWELRLAVNHVSATRTRAGQGPIPTGEGTDEFTVWSASGEYRPTPWIAVFAGVQNLTDEVYVVARNPTGARPGLPRNFVAGIRLSR